MTPSQTDRIRASAPDPRSANVLIAGLEAFVAHGPRRAAMQDIADRAGMSRAALYLVFRNKQDILDALMRAVAEAEAAAVSAALSARGGDVAGALTGAFEAQLGDATQAMMRSAHAGELLAEVPSGAVRRALARWLDAGVAAGRIDAAAVDGNTRRCARVMLAGIDGLRPLVGDWPAYLRARRHMVRLFARALVA